MLGDSDAMGYFSVRQSPFDSEVVDVYLQNSVANEDKMVYNVSTLLLVTHLELTKHHLSFKMYTDQYICDKSLGQMHVRICEYILQ